MSIDLIHAWLVGHVHWSNAWLLDYVHCMPAGGLGASVSACAGLANQLLSCWVDPRIAWIKHWHSNCRQPVDGGGGTPSPVLLTCKKIPFELPDLASSYLWAFRISLSLINAWLFWHVHMIWYIAVIDHVQCPYMIKHLSVRSRSYDLTHGC